MTGLPPTAGDYVAPGTGMAPDRMRDSLEGRAEDQVERLEAFRRRHPQVTVIFPGVVNLFDFEASWIEVSADPAVDGTAQRAGRPDLRALLDYLEALFDRGGERAAV